MASADADLYKVILIKPENAPLSAVIRMEMEKMGGHFDSDLQGIVFLDGGVPATIPAYMAANDLKAQRAQVIYDPEWFTPPSPEPVWETLPAQWNGHPPVIDDLPPLRWLWVCSPAQNDGKPFDIMWLGDGNWSTKDRKFTVAQIVEQGWKILATSGEVLDMTRKRMDQANTQRIGKAAKEILANDFDGSALQVAIITGRI